MKGLSESVSAQPGLRSETADSHRGKLLDFDAAELIGWIEGHDGNVYGFSAADVIDEKDIAVGDDVSFEADGEAASSVCGVHDEVRVAPQPLSGALVSYDADTLTGWIGIEGGEVFVFTAADVVGDEELSLGQRVTFLAAGERANQVQPLPAAPIENLRGQLLSYDTTELCGWIRSEDDRLFAFTAADVADEGEFADGQAVVFVAQGERASDVRVGSTRPPRHLEGRLVSYEASELRGWITGEDGDVYVFSAGDLLEDSEIPVGAAVRFDVEGERATRVVAMPALPVQPLDGRLLSYDATDLRGWIQGDDGNLYAFNVVDVAGDEELVAGCPVAFLGSGERATHVQSKLTVTTAQALCGTLVSFDAAELCGWIEGDGGNLFAFSVVDVVDEEELSPGQQVEFSGSAERAWDVRARRVRSEASRTLEGKLLTYDDAELCGWIEADDGNLYGFTVESVLGDGEILSGQRLSFRTNGDRAIEVRAIAVAAAQAMDGTLHAYDATDLIGVIRGADGQLYEFGGADIAGEEEIELGSGVTFVAHGDQASDVRAAPVLPARHLRGSLLSFEPADLSGWISGEDGEVYTFTAAEVIGDDEVHLGQRVLFVARGERASEVRAQSESAAELKSMRGRLMNYDPVELCGWIEGDDGNLYACSAVDIAGEEEIAVGQSVAFWGADERATEVRGAEPQARPRPMKGKLLSYSPDALEGSIAGEDRATYRFDGGDLLGDAEIRIGQSVSFVAIGKRATRVAEIPSAPLVIPKSGPRAPVVADLPVAPTAPLTGATQAPRVSRVPWLVAASILVVVLGVGGFVANRLFREGSTVPPPDVAGSPLPIAPSATANEGAPAEGAVPPSDAASSAPVGTQPEPIAQEPVPTPGAETASAAPSPTAEAAVAKPTPPISRSPIAANLAPAHVAPSQTQKATPEPAAIATAPPPSAPRAASHASSALPSDAPAQKPAAWWSASTAGQLNVIYVGRVAELPAIALMFDGDLQSAQAVNEHVRVTRADGTPVVARWTLGRNPRMVLLPARPGRYEVSVGAGLADASGRATKITLQGPVVVE